MPSRVHDFLTFVFTRLIEQRFKKAFEKSDPAWRLENNAEVIRSVKVYPIYTRWKRFVGIQ